MADGEWTDVRGRRPGRRGAHKQAIERVFTKSDLESSRCHREGRTLHKLARRRRRDGNRPPSLRVRTHARIERVPFWMLFAYVAQLTSHSVIAVCTALSSTFTINDLLRSSLQLASVLFALVSERRSCLIRPDQLLPAAGHPPRALAQTHGARAPPRARNQASDRASKRESSDLHRLPLHFLVTVTTYVVDDSPRTLLDSLFVPPTLFPTSDLPL